MSKRITRQPLSRRAMLKAAGATAGLVGLSALSACAGPAPAPSQTEAKPTEKPAAQPTTAPTKPAEAKPTAVQAKPTTAPGKFKEAPALAEQVKQGKLPPVDQRLPKEPLAIAPAEKVGQYGGRWRTGLNGRGDTAWMTRTVGYDGLVRWDLNWQKVVPNVAKKWEISPDGKEFTFYLREGMRWSDGEPFTADDVVFWYDDIIMNDQLTNAQFPAPSWFKTAGELGKVVKVDQYTFKMVFAQPNGLLMQRLATPDCLFLVQAKYAKQFHIKYSKDAVEKMVKDQNLTDWVALFQAKTWSNPQQDSKWFNPDRPTLFAWKLTSGMGTGTRLTAVRNPYYWKVDTEGNQLPYLDEIVYDIVESVDVLVLKAVNGEIDMMDRHIATNVNKPVFIDNKAKGSYDFFTTIPSGMNEMIIALNLNHKDPVLREIFRNKKVRMGLSHAINRKELIDVVFVGQGEPAQPAPLKESPFYNEQLKTQYTEYDVAKANQYLDEAGLTKKGSDGIRLRPDGKPLSIAVEVSVGQKERIDSLELIKKYWKAVGVDMQAKVEDRTLFYTRKAAYEHDAGVWGGDGGMDVVLEPRWYLPYSNESIYGIAWADWWITGGKKGEEPPAPTKKQQELYDQLKLTADDAKQADLMKQILQIAQEEFYSIGITTPVLGYGVVRNNFKNVPKKMFGSWLYPNPGPAAPEQFYIAK